MIVLIHFLLLFRKVRTTEFCCFATA